MLNYDVCVRQDLRRLVLRSKKLAYVPVLIAEVVALRYGLQSRPPQLHPNFLIKRDSKHILHSEEAYFDVFYSHLSRN